MGHLAWGWEEADFGEEPAARWMVGRWMGLC